MSHRSILLAAAAILPLAACNSGPTVEAEDATVEEVAAQVEAAGGTEAFMSPGKWRSQITIEEIAIPGMPAEMADQMKQQMAAQASTESCLTPEDVKKPDAEFFGGRDSGCKYDTFTMGGGKIDAKMVCGAGAQQQTMTMTGTYTPTRTTMTMAAQGAGSGPAGMTMKMRVDSERLGDC